MENKKYKTGLVIGKFYPFHLGHEYLLRTALASCQKLTVIICQTDKYLIPAEIRARWLKNTFPDADIKILYHGPELDSNSTNISEKWAEITIRFLKFVPEAVFSSEKYGAFYSKYLNSEHVMVDLNRRKFSTSGTKIRQNLAKNWNYLNQEAKSFFAKKVVIVGAESTGSTTLAKQLAQHYQTAWVPEYGRTYYEGKMTSNTLNNWSTYEFVHIATMQNQMETNLAKHANKVLICDTNSFATEIWHKRYVGFMANEVKKASNKSKADLYILTNTDIPFVQDGTRDGQFQRQDMHDLFLHELQKRKLPYLVVSGSRKKRLNSSIEFIDPLLSSWTV